MKNTVLFEYPLHERMRTWLRIEFIINQIFNSFPLKKTINSLIFFRLIDELLDILERNDIKNQLLKELERQKQKLHLWSNLSGVDVNLITLLCKELKDKANQLINSSKLGQQLREDHLIGLVRQRINIPGGYCSFDLPILHVWLHSSLEIRNNQITNWIKHLCPLYTSLKFILNLIRKTGTFHKQTTSNGFYQNNAEGSDLLRIQLELNNDIYPQISGHKNRFSIRFVSLNHKKNGTTPLKLEFQLACC
ncbi:MAG: cell division protein ZapD [Pantoea sp. Brub]|nr:cell division protein ZapD [Pantoea sp. Brub]